jgi:hypothetical protein
VNANVRDQSRLHTTPRNGHQNEGNRTRVRRLDKAADAVDALADIELQVVSTAVESLAESVEFCLSVRRTCATRCVAVAHTRTDAWPRKIPVVPSVIPVVTIEFGPKLYNLHMLL